jgi:hypothetical protein
MRPGHRNHERYWQYDEENQEALLSRLVTQSRAEQNS